MKITIELDSPEEALQALNGLASKTPAKAKAQASVPAPVAATPVAQPSPAPVPRKRGRPKKVKDPAPAPEKPAVELELDVTNPPEHRQALAAAMQKFGAEHGLPKLRDALREANLPRLQDAADEDLPKFQAVLDTLQLQVEAYSIY